jgi:cytochrome P450 family 110
MVGRAPAVPPGPTVRPFVQLMRWGRDPTGFLDDCARTYGDAFTLRFPGYPPIVVLSDPAANKDVFTGSLDEIHQGPFPPFMRPLLGNNSLFFLDGQRHLEERKLIFPPFHGERMAALGETIRTIANDSIDRWPIGTAFPLQQEMQRIALEVILRTVFGMTDGARFVALRRLLEGQSHVAKRTFRPSSLLTLLAMLVIPAQLLDRLYVFSGSRPLGVDISWLFPWGRGVRLQAAMDEILSAEIARARQEDGTGRKDILSMLVAARDEDGQPMSDRQLRDEMVTLLVAGHETTANALSWFFHLVLGAPESLTTLKAEIAEAEQGGVASLTSITALQYLDAAIKETLRVRPIVPHASRLLATAKTIGTRDLPAGVMLLPSIYLTQRRPEIYEDPERFRPERFLGKRYTPYEYFPFGGGVRRCIGMAFATYEMKIILSQILSRVSMRAEPGSRVRVTVRAITLAPSEGMPVIVDAVAPAPESSRAS